MPFAPMGSASSLIDSACEEGRVAVTRTLALRAEPVGGLTMLTCGSHQSLIDVVVVVSYSPALSNS
jgi:hypothetical protein